MKLENKLMNNLRLTLKAGFKQEVMSRLKNIENISEVLNKKINDINNKLENFNKINQSLIDVNKSIEELEKSIDDVEKSIEAISKNTDDFESINKNIKSLQSKTIRHARLIEEELGRINVPVDNFSDVKMRGKKALEYLIENCTFTTVLDIGCGEGKHSKRFVEADKKVTAIDYGKSEYFNHNDRVDVIIDDFNQYSFKQKFDCVWASHILEHQLNVNIFLKKIFNILNDDGILAITVPPAKLNVVGGHVSIWSAGLLIYNLILAGFDCSEAIVGQYDYDISVIVKKSSIPDDVFNIISYDVGDIRILRPYFPKCIEFINKEKDDIFNGANVRNQWVKN